MDYNISNMATEEIKEMLTDLHGEADEDTDIYFLLLLDELELRLPESDFRDFCQYMKDYGGLHNG